MCIRDSNTVIVMGELSGSAEAVELLPVPAADAEAAGVEEELDEHAVKGTISMIAARARAKMRFFMEHPHFLSFGFLLFLHCPVQNNTGRIYRRTQPFTEPMSIPFMKYFCTKGYTHRIGMIVKMMIAICSVNGCARSSIAVAD